MSKYNIKIGTGGKWIHSVGLGLLCMPLSVMFFFLMAIIFPLCFIVMPIAGLFGLLRLEEKWF